MKAHVSGPQGGMHGKAGVVILAIALVICLPGLGAWCGWAPDSFGWYLGPARILAETGALPTQRTVTPPGIMAVFAPLVMLFGDLPILAIRVVQAACLIAASVLTYKVHRDELGQRSAVMAALMVAGSPVLLRLSTIPLSEPLFVFLICAWLVLMNRWQRRGAAVWWEAAWGGALCGAAMMVRSIGIVVIPISAWVLWRDAKHAAQIRVVRIAALVLCAVSPMIAWELRQGRLSGSDSYRRAWTQAAWTEDPRLDGLALYATRIARFGPMRLVALKEALLPPDPFWRLYNGPLSGLSTWLIGGTIAAVGVARLLRFRSAADAYFVFTLGLLMLWPYDEGVRMVAPLIPVLIAYPIRACGALRRFASLAGSAIRFPKLAPVVTASFAVLIAFTQVAGLIQWQSKLPAYREKQAALLRNMRELASWEAGRLAANGRYVGITPQRDNSKLLLAGASYIAHRSVKPIDAIPGSPVELNLLDADAAIIHRSVAMGLDEEWAQRLCDASGEFLLYDNPHAAIETMLHSAAEPESDTMVTQTGIAD